MGVHESIIPAAVATMYQRTGGRLRMACSPEPAVFSGFWEVQSSAFFMITRSMPSIAFSLAIQLLAIPLFIMVRNRSCPADAARS
jgi:hypothetical protein